MTTTLNFEACFPQRMEEGSPPLVDINHPSHFPPILYGGVVDRNFLLPVGFIGLLICARQIQGSYTSHGSVQQSFALTKYHLSPSAVRKAVADPY